MDWLKRITGKPLQSLDLDRLLAIKECDEPGGSLLTEILDLYSETAPLCLQRIRRAVASGLPIQIEKAAHELKSSSANLGAAQLAHVCGILENQSAQPELNFDDLVKQIENELTRVLADAEIVKAARVNSR